MHRLVFEKKGNAVWISHLDLMRVFQRAFKRAGLPLTHGQGFNPRPFVSIALPLSVGVESDCELLDFELDGSSVPCEQICEKLNEALVDGVRVLKVYEDGRKIKHLALLDCVVTLEYDRGVPEGAVPGLREFFGHDAILVEKKSKSAGLIEQDIVPMIKSMDILQPDGNTLELHARVCCQNPTLNPMQLHAAILRHRLELAPDFAKTARIEIYDQEGNIFR